MTDTPDTTPAEAITAACNAAEIWTRHTLIAPRELGYRQGMVLAGLTAAAPLIAARAAAAQREADIKRWRASLTDAIEGMHDMLPYVRVYFHDKWEHQAYIDRAEAALADLLAAAPPETP